MNLKVSYAQVTNRWPALAEAEKLALCLHDVFSSDTSDWRNLPEMPFIDEFCLKQAVIWSILPCDQSLVALELLVKSISSFGLSSMDAGKLRANISDAYSVFHHKKFCSAFLRNNARMSSVNVWSNLASYLNESVALNLGIIGLPADFFSPFGHLLEFDYADLVNYPEWRPNYRSSSAEAFQMTVSGQHYSIQEADIILHSGRIALVKAEGSSNAFIANIVEPGRAVAIAAHHAAADLIGRLKADSRISPSADTWEVSASALQRGRLTWFGYSILGVRDWFCSMCGTCNKTAAKDVIASSSYDDGMRQGTYLLVECKQCLRTALVVVAVCVRSPSGKTFLSEGVFTTAAGPIRSEVISSFIFGGSDGS